MISFVAFAEELEKIARITSNDLPGEVQVTHNLNELILQAKPGDIIITKPNEETENWLHKSIQGFQRARGKQFPNWVHGGVVTDANRLMHASLSLKSIKEGTVAGSAKVRKHSITGLDETGRDMLILRPNVSEETRQKAVERVKTLTGTPFDKLELLRAGLLPAAKKKGEMRTKPPSLICTGAVSYSYPKIDFHQTKSFRHLMPADIITSGKATAVIAYSSDKEKKP